MAVSYLPLSHIAAQIIDVFLVLYGRGTTFYADKLALQVGGEPLLEKSAER